MGKRTTINDIARETGFSVTAISLVLNDRPNRIPERSRRRILEVAARLNYHPNQQAVNLLRNQTRTIAEIIPDIANNFYASLVRGADSVIHPKGYSLILSYTDNDPERELDAIRDVLIRGVDGILFSSSNNLNTEPLVKLLRDSQVPTVMIDRTGIEDGMFCSVSINHRLGGYIATRHLLGLGHRKIACIYGGTFRSLEMAPRLQGYLRAYQEMGLKAEESSFFSGDYGVESGYRITEQLLGQGYTAAFYFNESMALGGFRRLMERNYRVPDDFSMIAYGESYLAPLLTPPLTTVAQEPRVLGIESAKYLFRLMEDPGIARDTICFDPVLNVRGSTGRVPENPTSN